MGILSMVWPANDTRHLALDPVIFEMSWELRSYSHPKNITLSSPQLRLSKCKNQDFFSSCIKMLKKNVNRIFTLLLQIFIVCPIQLEVATCIKLHTGV